MTDLVKLMNYLGSQRRFDNYKNHPTLGDRNLQERLNNISDADIDQALNG